MDITVETHEMNGRDSRKKVSIVGNEQEEKIALFDFNHLNFNRSQ